MTTRNAFYLIIIIIIISPILYYSTGIGQQASTLSQELIVLADGGLKSSPKAEAYHHLSLPIRIERFLILPLFLFLFQYSGLAVKLRVWLSKFFLSPLEEKAIFQIGNNLLKRFSRNKLNLTDCLLIGLYITVFSVGLSLIYFPFSFYTGFILRHQFGLSTQTLGTWMQDFSISWGVNLIISLILYGGFYTVLRIIPRSWPLWGGLFFSIFIFGYILLEPIVITPLFYTISPVTDADLINRIQTMANQANMVIDDISIIDASSKTTTINAYFSGFGDASKIILWDTLLIKHPPDEVDVVIAHEMGHWIYNHVLLYISATAAGVWVGLFALRFWLHSMWQKLGWQGPDDVAGYPYLLGLVALLTVLSLPIVNSISRYAEDQADDFAITISKKPQAAIDLFMRIGQENLSMVNVPTWEKIIFYTHPPLDERIENIKSLN